ncbi:hypothetical protein IMZ31_24285 (plasmid) [Pontibacillus sp. ALD_SL1]|uniref:hypothetical protein n=1 Tax=Pontibacillus sp. ALD_SL1 TaxID=2777185 RepID=UPI001A9659DA|nr:hypothetical protein [Pontibacillus sp. ALD_SL1]QST02572.1 hypothetical protein IMZ31_24285 [Pontibacillus sp. ALD_SL1]
MYGLYTEWKTTHHDLFDYVLLLEVRLLSAASLEPTEIGTAQVVMTDEKWLGDRGNLPLVDYVHYDFNDERNWYERTPYEYLEDTLRCTRYGQGGGTHGKLARILKVEIHREYRGNGHFHFLFGRILDMLKKWDVDVAALMPSPFGDCDRDPDGDPFSVKVGLPEEGEAERRLQTLYSRYGFEKCDNEGIPYMTLRL